MAPEVIQGLQYDEKCDIFSLGVVFYTILAGNFPFGGACDASVFKNIVYTEPVFDQDNWIQIDPRLVNLIMSMLIKDPVDRPSATECLEH